MRCLAISHTYLRRVAAFEGMSSNVALVRSSVCASPGLGGRLRLHALGLGAAPTTCFLFSDVNNQVG